MTLDQSEVLLQFAAACTIFALWVIIGAILWRRRRMLPQRYALVWASAFSLGVLQVYTLAHIAIPDYSLLEYAGLVAGALRAVSIVTMLAFIWATLRSENDDT